MTEAKWLASSDLLALVTYLARRGSDRRHRLFACACLRRVWDLLQVDATRRAVEVTEAFADGEASEADLRAANDPAAFAVLDTSANLLRRAGERTRFTACALHAMHGAVGLVMGEGDFRKTRRAHFVAEMTCADRAQDYVVTRARPWGGKYWVPTDEGQLADRTRLLRDVFGNPFRPVTLALVHRTPAVVSLARAAYDERLLPSGELDPHRLAVLADALEETGAPAELVAHLRSPGPHVRGCHVVDLCLGLC